MYEDSITHYQHISGEFNAQVIGNGTASVTSYHYHYPTMPEDSVIDATIVEEAKRQLSSMPLETIPELSPLPPDSYMPLSPNPLFVGREKDLQTLAASIKGEEAVVVSYRGVTATTGIGGIGKTQLVSEFVHRYGQYFRGGIFWLNFSLEDTIPTEIVRSFNATDLALRTNFPNLPLEEKVRLVLSIWQNPLPRLLVFDNCEDENLLNRWRPRTGGSRVLITTRKQIWPLELEVRLLPIDTLPRQESISLLQKYRPDLLNAELNSIADELGDLPLALSLAGGFLRKYNHTKLGTPNVYLEQLKQVQILEHDSLQGRGSTISPTNHELNVERTFALSYEKLTPANSTDNIAIALLIRASYFPEGESIPHNLLKATLYNDGNDPDTELQIEDALERLTDLGLVEVSSNGEGIRLHHLLATFIIKRRTKNYDIQAQLQVERTLLREAEQVSNAGYSSAMLNLQPHLIHITSNALRRNSDLAVDLSNELGLHLKWMGAYEKSLQYLEDALKRSIETLGPYHPQAGACLNNTADSYEKLGKYDKAEIMLQESLSILNRFPSFDKEAIITSMRNLGCIYSHQGKYKTAEPLLKRSLAKCKKVFGINNFKTAQCLSALADLYNHQRKYEEAEQLYKDAISIYENTLGADHPDTMLNTNGLAALYQRMKNYSEAENLYIRVLNTIQRIIGEDHPDFAITCNNLANIYIQTNKYQEAEEFLQRAINILETIGYDCPDRLISLSNLAELYIRQKKYERAERILLEIYSLQKKNLGLDHPHTARSIIHLADLYEDWGKYKQSEELYLQAISVQKKALGVKHLDVASSIEKLASFYEKQNKYDKAETLYIQANSILNNLLGSKHIDTTKNLALQANLYQKLGNYEMAEKIYEQVRTTYTKYLGADHSETLTILNNLAVVYANQQKSNQAEMLYKQVLRLRKKIYGRDHPNTISVFSNLGIHYVKQKKYKRAETLLLHVLKSLEEDAYSDPLDIALCFNNLAFLYDNQGRYDTAEPLYLHAIAVRKEILGINHSETADVIYNLAIMYKRQGDYNKAEAYCLQALTIQKKVFGASSVEAIGSMIELINMRKKQGKEKQTRALLRQTLKACEKTLGQNHPLTADIQKAYNTYSATNTKN